jgi:hypothetical protein
MRLRCVDENLLMRYPLKKGISLKKRNIKKGSIGLNIKSHEREFVIIARKKETDDDNLKQ